MIIIFESQTKTNNTMKKTLLILLTTIICSCSKEIDFNFAEKVAGKYEVFQWQISEKESISLPNSTTSASMEIFRIDDLNINYIITLKNGSKTETRTGKARVGYLDQKHNITTIDQIYYLGGSYQGNIIELLSTENKINWQFKAKKL